MSSDEPLRFTTELYAAGRGGAGFDVPHDVAATLSDAKRPPVVVTVGGYSFRTRLAVYGGQPMVGVSKENRAAAGVDVGDRFEVTLVVDDEPRVVEAPPDLAEALAGRPELAAVFEALSFTHRREYVRWIEEAKRPETRQRRVAGTLDRLSGEGGSSTGRGPREGS
jgi:hypothetical protein